MIRSSVLIYVAPRIHGGSFYQGAATWPGLDGSALALSTGSIVVTLQYRLGVLGFLPPSSLDGSINLGVRDVTIALTFLHNILPSFKGDPDSITVAGQSSGGMMVRCGYHCSVLIGTTHLTDVYPRSSYGCACCREAVQEWHYPK